VLEDMSHSFTSERRPGRTCHALSAIEPRRIAGHDIPLRSFRTASCRAARVSRGAVRTVSLLSPAAKTFSFRARYAIRPTNADALALIISQSSEARTHRLSASIPPTTHTRNGRETFCCACCAPIDLCCCEETGAVYLPARAAAGAKAAAILGICRVYVEEAIHSERRIGANSTQ
jgi:hypothetical protein